MENPFPLQELQRIGPVLLIFATATIVLLVDLFLRGWRRVLERESDRDRRKSLLWLISGAGILLAGGLLAVDWNSPAATVFEGAVRVDPFSNAIAALILLGSFLTLFAAPGALRRVRMEHGEFYALTLYAAGGMILLAQSNNLILIFLSLETFSMAVYVLAAYTRDERRSVEGALKYFLLGGLASGFLLLGLTFIFAACDTIRLDAIHESMVAILEKTRQQLAANPGSVYTLTYRQDGVDTSLLFAGLAMTLVGFGFKVGAFPFHAWIPDIYEGSSSVVTGFMAVTVKAAGFAILVKLVLAIAVTPQVSEPVLAALWWIAIATMVVANLVALVQQSVKRMLAYSAVSHTGYLLIGVVSVLPYFQTVDRGMELVVPASQGASILFYLLPYTLMTFGSFALLASLGREDAAGETFGSFRGLAQRRPVIAFSTMIFMVSLSGIPPTAGFWGKLYLFREAVESGHWELALVGVLASVVSVYYYLRLVVVMYMQKPATESPPATAEPVNWGAALATALAALAVIGVGLDPEFFLEQSAETVRTALMWGK